MAQQAENKVLIIELTDRYKSGFVLEGSKEEGQPIHLDGPAWRRIPPESTILQEDGTYRYIRHIVGAPSIFKDEQVKLGIEFNPVRDNIVLNTVTTIVRTGRDVNKFDYLQACEYNLHAPKSPGKENIIFREIRTEEIATTDVKSLKFKKKAMDIIDTLYSDAGDKPTYDRTRMNTIARALGISDEQGDSVVLMAISAFAERDPKRFLETIADKTVEYRQDIKEAIHLGVLSMDDPGASLTANKTIFFKFKKKAPTERIEELVMYYLSLDGSMDYKNLRAGLDTAREALAGAK